MRGRWSAAPAAAGLAIARRAGHMAARPRQDCLSLMPRYKQALEQSRRVAEGLGVQTAETQHLLAGVVAVRDSMAVEILRRLKVTPEDVRLALAERMDVEPQRLGEHRRRRRRLLVGTR